MGQSFILEANGLSTGKGVCHLPPNPKIAYSILWNKKQMQLYAVNFIPLLGSLYMFRVFYTPIIRSTIFNCIYSHWYKP